ncbi:MAG: RnfABCDGE type electron transport complex subunit G [Candidatus Gastranaerophilales bacterium]|nr:RnfABCDGE type electron transport complex subunit G [Candidatus Gastranaerophilales bacterium]
MRKKDDVSVMLKEAGILFAITLIAGLLLGFVYELTKEPIRLQEEKAIQEACRAVFGEASAFEEISYVPEESLRAQLAEDGVRIGTVYAAMGDGKNLLGYVIESVTSEGYGGNIALYLGVALDGTLKDISILEISETAGLGMKAEDVLAPQFHERQVNAFTYTKTGSQSESEIDAISGATITTRAVTEAVNGGLRVAEALIQGGAGNE